MIRYGMGLLAVGVLATGGIAACSDDSGGDLPPPPPPTGGATGSGGAATGAAPGNGGATGNGGAVTGGGCVGECCPSDNKCYSSSAGKTAPGAECMARHVNPDPTEKPAKGHITMRQTWIRVMEPPGNTIAIVYGALNAYTSLPEPSCNTPTGTSGYMQLTDMDLTDPDPTKHTSTVGYATFVENVDSTIAEGACFGTVGAPGWIQKAPFPLTTDPPQSFALPENMMSDSSAYPPGLPKPMAQGTKPWTMGPTVAARTMTDFDVKTQRTELLASFAPGGSREGKGGVFYFDETAGTIHGYSPISWQIFYDARTGTETKPSSGFLLPIREAETKFKTNNPKQPTCIGKYRSDFLTMANDCASPAPENPAWGGIFNTTPGESDAEITGYFLITELEQVYSKVLGSTLCVSYPAGTVTIDQGFSTAADKRCRATGKFDGSKPNNEGLPMGNWCAATNSAATPTCHDAWRSRSFHAFQGFKIKTSPCPVEWAPSVP